MLENQELPLVPLRERNRQIRWTPNLLVVIQAYILSSRSAILFSRPSLPHTGRLYRPLHAQNTAPGEYRSLSPRVAQLQTCRTGNKMPAKGTFALGHLHITFAPHQTPFSRLLGMLNSLYSQANALFKSSNSASGHAITPSHRAPHPQWRRKMCSFPVGILGTE